MQKLLISLFIVCCLPVLLYSQKAGHDTICVSNDEQHLAEMINNLRKQNKLPEIPLSNSLCFVAKSHVRDLQINRPDTSICNTGSWSDKGKWTPCCYNKYVLKTDCMMDKPKELTPYKFRGYEISYFEEGIVHADSLFDLWSGTPEVADMLLARGIHSDKKWQAMGISIGDNYVCLWLGQRPDPLGKPGLCSKDAPAASVADNGKKDEKSGKYYLIYGSFSMQKEADEEVKKHQANGFKNAQILKKGEKIRVALGVYNSIKEAMAAKEKYKEQYKDAWILKN